MFTFMRDYKLKEEPKSDPKAVEISVKKEHQLELSHTLPPLPDIQLPPGITVNKVPVFHALKVVNYVCNAYTVCTMPLEMIAMVLGGRLNTALFPALVIYGCCPDATISIFKTGKLVAAGCKSFELGILAIHRLITHIDKMLGLHATLCNACLDNVVGTFGLGYALDLDLFKAQHPGDGICTYTPELFRGLCYKCVVPNRYKANGKPVQVYFILFFSGEGVITGSPTESIMKEVYDSVDFPQYRLGNQYFDPEKRERLPDKSVIARTAKIKVRHYATKQEKLTVQEPRDLVEHTDDIDMAPNNKRKAINGSQSPTQHKKVRFDDHISVETMESHTELEYI